MASKQGWLPSELPIVPASLLRKHRVLEKGDTRFRAAARLLQALWREEQELPIGLHNSADGSQRRIGSLISPSAAAAGRNFLSPAVARLVRTEVVYRERGALIDTRRLFGNLVSSAPLAFNLWAPLSFNPVLATKVLRELIPGIDLRRVLSTRWEHSPGRIMADLTNDRSAFDVGIIYERQDGRRCFIGIEQKFTETGHESRSGDNIPRFDELAHESGLFKNPAAAQLRVNPLAQLFREHLLAQAVLIRGDFAECRFMLVAPRHNHLVQQAASQYAAHLTECGDGQAPFLNLELEQVIQAIGRAGEIDFALALHDRYADWGKIHDAVHAALDAEAGSWHINAPRALKKAGLLSLAA